MTTGFRRGTRIFGRGGRGGKGGISSIGRGLSRTRGSFSRITAVGGGGNHGFGSRSDIGWVMITLSDSESLKSLSNLSRGAIAIVPRLRSFRKTFGPMATPTGTPRPYPHSKSLGGWVATLRRRKRQRQVTVEKKNRTDSAMVRPQTALISKQEVLPPSTHSNT